MAQISTWSRTSRLLVVIASAWLTIPAIASAQHAAAIPAAHPVAFIAPGARVSALRVSSARPAASRISLAHAVISIRPRAMAYDDPYLNGYLNDSSSTSSRDGHRHGNSGSTLFVPILYGYGYGGYDDSGASAAVLPDGSASDATAAVPADASSDQYSSGDPGYSQDRPQVIIIHEPAPANADAAPDQSQQPDEGQFTLVLHDGHELEALAFTKSGGQFVYIAIDGTRHTLAFADLDAGATQLVNQERGTALQLTF